MRQSLIAVFFIFAAFPLRAEPPKVAVSIKPIHSLIVGVMKGLGEPSLIIKGAASPHAFALKPSDAKQLSQAQLIFWVGPGIEGGLAKALVSLTGKARVVALASNPMLGLPEAASEAELHFWLDPGKARAVVAIAVAELGTLDPSNIFQYRANGQKVSLRIDYLEMMLHQQLSPVAKVPFLVFHDAYRHLARAYSLSMVGAIAVNPETPPSVKHMSKLSDKIKNYGVRCLFQETQFESRLAHALVDGTKVKIAYLDPMGASLDPGYDLYFKMMQANAESLAGCLGG